jgi:hypothetical protein
LKVFGTIEYQSDSKHIVKQSLNLIFGGEKLSDHGDQAACLVEDAAKGDDARSEANSFHCERSFLEGHRVGGSSKIEGG